MNNLSFESLEDMASNNEILGIFYSSIANNPYLTDDNKIRSLDMVVMRYVHGMKYREIGEEYGVSPNRAMQIIAKTLRIMRGNLAYIEKYGVA